MRVYLDVPPLNWKHGLATVRKLRFLFNPPEVIYELNTRIIKVDLYNLYGFVRRIVDLIYSGYSLLFLTGYGSYCKILNNIDIVHCIGSLIKYNKPTLYEIDISPIEFFYYYGGISLFKLMHVYHYFENSYYRAN